MTTTAHAASNPLLSPALLPDFPAIRPEHVMPAVETVLTEYRATVETLVADPAARDFDSLVAPLERLDEALAGLWSPIAHLHGVRDSSELREVYGQADEAITEFTTALGQHRGLYEAMKAVREGAGFEALDRAQRTLVEDSLRGFRLAGVALEEPARTRFRAIQTELSKLDTAFEEAVLDATEAWTLPLAEAQLAGLPPSARDLLAGQARDKGQEGFLATLKGPVVQALLSHADDRALRETVYTAYNTRASDQGPHAGRFDNSERIARILALRHEAAQLLGLASAAHESLEDKMAGTPERVLGFLRELAAKARPVALRELDELRAFAATELGLHTLQPWDVAYASEKLRVARYTFEEEQLKAYFALPRVLEGLLALSGELFDVRFAERFDVPRWHPDVQYFDVLDADGVLRAGVYFDHYAREGKRGGAWMDVCRSRFGLTGQIPVAYLTCNAAPPGEGRPSLLTHDDVLTLFHEFGHGLHHLLTEIGWPSVSGIHGVEWDAVELPSQFMENFGWKREALDRFARHGQTGEALPDDLFAKMSAARHFQAGLFLVRQLEFALYDFRLHLEYDPVLGPRTLELLDAVRAEVSVITPPCWQRFPHSFTHIFGGGYAAGYYSYLWAEVLSADAFAAFEEAAAAGGSVFDAATGARLRREVLAVGGSRPALESFIAFRGRAPDPQALLRSHGLAA
ncbi:M3 family metallopeptidase [Silanimonas sp.]|uniref:M3 family metallopeptidase n=1 Tax=Silanimonas sp. TaxID=1929290 RepID=UPI001BC238BD|nr:M3 family metallopeptidase [Silanimonas sp.]MBS3896788.1 M3 family metallopeptidase [Silanimonas sp.]MBS3924150.1 M3 family metallopeptidase [Xanthomonadaceae bacterium]